MKLLLGDLARELGVNVYYLSHFFREQFGLSFQEYVGKLRCEKARRELLLTDRSLLDISLACGFSSPKYFQRAFARQYGAAPREYRRLAPRESEARQTPGVLTSQEFLSDEQSLSIVQRLLEQLP
ncbi:MAG: helix-turn-helix transcriptional regulator [Dysosmobacter sp.]